LRFLELVYEACIGGAKACHVARAVARADLC